MNSSNPSVSVVMPAYNAERYIGISISSILDQTFADFELLVIDDGSTDRTGEIVCAFADPRVRLFRNEKNLRMAATLNRGLELARGEFVARMDADDIADRNRLARQVRHLRDHPGIALVGTGMTLVDERGRKIGASVPVTDPDLLRWRNHFANQIAHPTAMFRRATLDRLELRYGAVPAWAAQSAGAAPVDHLSEDYLMFGLLALRDRVANIPDCLLEYRVHDKSISGSQSEAQMSTAHRVSALLFDEVLERPVSREVVQHVYFTRPLSLKGAMVEDACGLIDRALAKHVRRYNLTPAALAPLKRDAELRKRVLRSGSASVWRRIAQQFLSPLWPRDGEERKLLLRSLVSERQVERFKQWRSRLMVQLRRSTKL